MRAFAFVLLLPCLSLRLVAQNGWEWQNPTPHGFSVNDIVMVDWDRVIGVCDNGRILRSWDGGRTWSTSQYGMYDYTRVVSLGGNDILVASEEDLVLRSSDFGDSWSVAVQQTTTMSTFADMARIDGNTVLTMLGGLRLFLTTDRGATWSTIPSPAIGNETIRTIAVQSPSMWWVVTNRNVYRTGSAGAVWEPVASIQARGLQRFVFIDSLYGYQVRNGQVLQTLDGTASWKEMDIFGFDINVGVAAGGTLGNVVYVLSEGNFIVNKSTDDGATWNISLTGAAFPDAYPTSMSFISPDRGVIAGTGGRILRTEDAGITWSITHGLGYLGSIAALSFTTPKDGLALTYSETALRTTTGGVRWDETLPAAGYSLRKMSFYSPTSGFAVGLDGQFSARVFHTTDLGRTWSPRSVLPYTQDMFRSNQPMSILSVSRDTVFAAISYGIVYRSLDGAISWDSLFVHNALLAQWNSGFKMFFFRPGTILHASSSGIASSTDLGSTWTFFPVTGGRTMSQVQFFNAQNGNALLSGTLSRTSDGGKTWTIGTTSGLNLIHFFDDQKGIAYNTSYSGNDRATIRRTDDGGLTWTDYPLLEYGTFSDWFILSPNEGWAYGLDGMIRHTRNGGITTAESPERPNEMLFHPVHPNPFSPSQHGGMSLSFTLSGTTPVTVGIYNSVGGRVAALAERVFQPGTHILTFDPIRAGIRMPSGMYIIRLAGGRDQFTQRLMVIR